MPAAETLGPVATAEARARSAAAAGSQSRKPRHEEVALRVSRHVSEYEVPLLS